MTTQGRQPGAIAVPLTATAVNTPATSGEGMTLCQAADSALLDQMTPRFHITDVGTIYAYLPSPAGGALDMVVSYTPSPQARFLRIETTMPGNVLISGGYQVKLSFTDGTTTISSTDTSVSHAPGVGTWNNSPMYGSEPTLLGVLSPQNRYQFADHSHAAFFDLDYLRAHLTASFDWSIKFEFTFIGSGYVLSVMGMELPRSVVDQSVGLGVVPGDCFPNQPITDSLTDSLPSVLYTLQKARTTQARYLCLSWPQDITTGSGYVPFVGTTALSPFTYLSEDTSTPTSFTVPVRQVYAGSAQGELVRWRVNYYTEAGTNLQVVMSTGSSSNPFIATLTDTSGTWQWSDWQTGYLVSNGTTVLTGAGVLTGNLIASQGFDSIAFQGKCSASGHRAWLSCIQVEGNCQ